MAVVLGLSAADPLRCRFAVSPLWEVMAAVRALREDRGARHAPWLADLPVTNLRECFAPLLLVQPPGRASVPDFLSPPPRSAVGQVEEELARVAATAPAVVAHELRACLGDREPELQADPAAARDLLVGLEREAWHALVAPHWPRLLRLLQDDVAHHAGVISREGLGPALVGLDPRLTLQDGALVLAAPYDDRRELGGEGLVLVPSAFSWPSAAVLTDPGYLPTLVYPARGIALLWEQAARPPAALARLLGRGRAAVLLATEVAASTSDLAARLELAPATVSEHLAALRDAGLVAGRRDGRRVLYARTPVGDDLVTGAGARPSPTA